MCDNKKQTLTSSSRSIIFVSARKANEKVNFWLRECFKVYSQYLCVSFNDSSLLRLPLFVTLEGFETNRMKRKLEETCIAPSFFTIAEHVFSSGACPLSHDMRCRMKKPTNVCSETLQSRDNLIFFSFL